MPCCQQAVRSALSADSMLSGVAGHKLLYTRICVWQTTWRYCLRATCCQQGCVSPI